MLKTAVLIGLAVFIGLNECVQAEVLATCQEPSGQSYYMKSPLVPDYVPSWEDDAISGKVVTLRRDGGNYDLEVSGEDIIGDGGKQYLAWKAADSVSIVVIYGSQLIETYTFDLINRSLIWSQTRQSHSIRKGSLLVALCH